MRVQTQLEILDRIYNIINDTTVTDYVDIYINKPVVHQGQELGKHLVINALPLIANETIENQQVYVNINIFYPVYDGVYEMVELDTVNKAVLQLLNDYDQQGDGSYLQFAIDAQGVIDDPRDEKYINNNIRLEVYAQKIFEEGE